MLILQLVRLIRKARARKRVGFALVGFLLSVALLGNAACFYLFDGPGNPDLGLDDALWYSVVSITTMGYGDFFAKSTGARIGTIVFIVFLGLGTFSVFLSMLIDWTSTFVTMTHRGLGKAMAKNHVIIVHFPHRRRIQHLIDEIRADPEYARREIVLVNDQIDEVPFQLDNLLFVRGSTLDADTYERANVRGADLAIVLAHDYTDPDSDAVVAAAASVINGLKPEIHLVAECMDDRHLGLFDTVRCDAVVPGMTISGNLLVQESHDPGVARTVSMLTTRSVGASLYSARVPAALTTDYATLAKRLLDHDIHLLSVNRGDTAHTSIRSLLPEPGDVVVYVAGRRLRWPEILAQAGLS